MGSLQSRFNKTKRNSQERFFLSKVPGHLILAVINKTNPKSFKNVYSSSRSIQSLIEKGRTQIRIFTPFVMEIDFLQDSVLYTLRPSWFGKGTTLSLAYDSNSPPLADHFLGISFFKFAKISFKHQPGKAVTSVLYQLEQIRVRGEKVSFGGIGYSSQLVSTLRPISLELTEEGISSGVVIPQEILTKMKSVTLRLENISRISLQEAFRHLISKAKHADILGADESQESLFNEIFLFSKKIGEGACRTEGFKLIIFKHRMKSVQNMLESFTKSARMIYSDGNYFLFQLSGDQKRGLAGTKKTLVYVDWQKETRIRMMTQKTLSKEEGMHFLTHLIPLDKDNYSSMARMKANFLQFCQ